MISPLGSDIPFSEKQNALFAAAANSDFEKYCQLASIVADDAKVVFFILEGKNIHLFGKDSEVSPEFWKTFLNTISTEESEENFIQAPQSSEKLLEGLVPLGVLILRDYSKMRLGGFAIADTAYRTLSPSKIKGLKLIGEEVCEMLQQNRLRESNLLLGEFFENSQGLMCTHDLEGNFLTVNFAGAKMIGFTQEEILKKSLYDLVPKSFHPRISGYLEEIKTKGKAEGQMQVITKNGTQKVWLFNNILQYPDNGQKPYIIGNAVDITSRVRLEKDIKETKELLEETGRVARVGGWELDLLTNKLSWTPVTAMIHEVEEGYVPKLEEGIHFYKEGESREIISKAVDRAIRYGEPWNLDLQIVTAKGRNVWVRAVGKAIQEKGKTIRLVGTFQDIDLAKKAELEAANAKKLLDDVFNASSEVSVIATDTQGLITVFNRGAEKLLGYKAKELVGKHTPEIIHCKEEIIQHSQEVSEEFGEPVEGFQVFVARAEKYGSEKKNWTYICKDGTRRQVDLVVTPIRDTNQTVIGFLGIAVDITEKRKVEIELINEKSRLSAFVKHTPAAVAMLDRDLNYLAVSNRWVNEFKLQESEVIGRSHYDLFADIITDESYVWHQQVLQGEVVGRQEEQVFLPGIEEPQYLSWEMRPWYLYDGTIGGMMVLSQNVTEMVVRRQELQEAKTQAEEASKAKSEFLANMSHEIRTPLNGVIGFTDLVLKTKLNETQAQYLNIVHQSANSLLGIISDILDFSKIEAGKLELDIDKNDLYSIASQATDIITYQIQKKGLEMLLNVDTNLPRFIYADAVRLKQVMVNLLGNAAKFTEKGEIELKIEQLQQDGDRSMLRFSVRDTGIGIAPQKQAKIFEAFSQEDSSTTKKYGGTGLGLTISNKLLGLMESKLQLKSKQGEGSLFYFDIWFKSEEGDAIDWDGLEEIKDVLVVDDNENNRLIVSQMLRLKNIKTHEATNGFEALQFLATGNSCDVVLMDYHMPFMDGLETIKKIRESFQDHLDEMPILLLHSSSDDSKLIQECKNLNVKFRLIKPLKIQELYHVLSHLSEKQDLNQIKEEEEVQLTQAYRILVAEDNQVNMLLAESLLKKIFPNCILQKALNGQEAIELCQKQAPDLILMDVQMPVMNGYEATKEIRSLDTCKDIPIIALTAGNVKGEREKCISIGMDDFVVKPVVEKTMKEVLYRWLSQSEPEKDPNLEDEKIQLLHFDQEKLIKYTDGNKEFLANILKLVQAELGALPDTLALAVDSASLETVKEFGHKLYGTAISSGMDLLAVLSKELELQETWEEPKIRDLADKILKESRLVLSLMAEKAIKSD
ncbi:PAS domain-containing hybrid sensor histidine kinase/response regulator [Algoriphagus mannitolivorans]|uniref:PAS domain-containing hybrid sensor histidine kinase/response regulator n=1 Tax=Algoriphagus mannitolivorans TaxID=226504 RepID=UPI00041D79D2|nr:PAS domain S-box protein [Algoriphagus mannitolivorans]